MATGEECPGAEEDHDHHEDGGQGDSHQLPGLRGPPDNGQNRFLGQEISFGIPGISVRASHEARKSKVLGITLNDDIIRARFAPNVLFTDNQVDNLFQMVEDFLAIVT